MRNTSSKFRPLAEFRMSMLNYAKWLPFYPFARLRSDLGGSRLGRSEQSHNSNEGLMNPTDRPLFKGQSVNSHSPGYLNGQPMETKQKLSKAFLLRDSG